MLGLHLRSFDFLTSCSPGPLPLPPGAGATGCATPAPRPAATCSTCAFDAAASSSKLATFSAVAGALGAPGGRSSWKGHLAVPSPSAAWSRDPPAAARLRLPQSSHRRRSRLSRWRFGRIRQQRLEGALGAIPGPIVHMIGRHCGSFGDRRKLRHGAGLGAAPFQHVRRFVVRRRHVMRRDNTQTCGHELDAGFGSRGKIVEGWFRWRRGVHGRVGSRGRS